VLVFALLGVAMDIENSDTVSDSLDDGDDVGDNVDELCAVTQAVITAMLRFSIIFAFSITNGTSFVINKLSNESFSR
jgi:hypothetical protein